ncbi:MAG: selenoneine biosynthesis selenosugar synthase SenB [Myxococcaceae bacterium]
MKIRLIAPVRRGSLQGNGVTARRWARLLRELGHQVRQEAEYQYGAADVLVALHARKSHASAERFKAMHPDGCLVVALTGTDLYQDLKHSRAARNSLQLADRIVVLQPLALGVLHPHHRRKACVIYQSATRPSGTARARSRHFEICVIGHLRPVKDPFRTALAIRVLPEASRIRVTHLGGALASGMARRAQEEARRNPRYRWLGERPQAEALRRLSRSDLLVLTSRSEGGANVISEAVAAGVPVVSSRIPGSEGLLGPSYPGYFPSGDTKALAELLWKVEQDGPFRRRLVAYGRRLRPLFRPGLERRAWAQLLRYAAAPRGDRPPMKSAWR